MWLIITNLLLASISGRVNSHGYHKRNIIAPITNQRYLGNTAPNAFAPSAPAYQAAPPHGFANVRNVIPNTQNIHIYDVQRSEEVPHDYEIRTVISALGFQQPHVANIVQPPHQAAANRRSKFQRPVGQVAPNFLYQQGLPAVKTPVPPANRASIIVIRHPLNAPPAPPAPIHPGYHTNLQNGGASQFIVLHPQPTVSNFNGQIIAPNRIGGNIIEIKDRYPGDNTGGNIGNHIGVNTGNHFGGNTGNQNENTFGNHIGGNTGNQIGGNIGHHIGGNIGNHLGGNIGNHIGSNIGHHIGGNTGNRMGGNFGNQFGGNIVHSQRVSNGGESLGSNRVGLPPLYVGSEINGNIAANLGGNTGGNIGSNVGLNTGGTIGGNRIGLPPLGVGNKFSSNIGVSNTIPSNTVDTQDSSNTSLFYTSGSIGGYLSQSESGQLDPYAFKQLCGDPRPYKRIITTCHPNGQCEKQEIGEERKGDNGGLNINAVKCRSNRVARDLAGAYVEVVIANTDIEPYRTSTLRRNGRRRPRDRRMSPYTEVSIIQYPFN